MIEKIQVLWENITFYGPAFGSILIVLAGSLVGLLLWRFIKKMKGNVDKDTKKQ